MCHRNNKDLLGLSQTSHPLFIVDPFSAKIYGFRVDALHTETQKLSGNILNVDEPTLSDVHNDGEDSTENNHDPIDSDQLESKKAARRVKAKATSFVAIDLAKITLEHEFEFRPLQPPNMCQWRGGIGKDSVYAEMVSSTMYSSSDYPLVDGFVNASCRPDEQQTNIDRILEHTTGKMIDVVSLRDVIKNSEGHDHILGSYAPSLRRRESIVSLSQGVTHCETSHSMKWAAIRSLTRFTKVAWLHLRRV